MRDVADLLNRMRAAGVITDYALFGAVAQMRYTEPVATLDADVLVAVAETDRADVLSPLYRFCEEQGYRAEGEPIRGGAWPVQFIPAFNALTRAAMEQAETADFEGIALRVVRADYLAVLSVGRAKDFARILALLESGSVTREHISTLAARHGLADAWRHFEGGFSMNDIRRLLERQAAWQRSRASLSWPEKVRMCEAIRHSVLQFRRGESRSTSDDSISSSSMGPTPTPESPSSAE